jgi:hypothetical protein
MEKVLPGHEGVQRLITSKVVRGNDVRAGVPPRNMFVDNKKVFPELHKIEKY